MISFSCSRFARHVLLPALLLAIGLVFVVPGISQAHAILLRSDPAKDAILNAAPSQVRMWFSEDLNPTFSTAVVVNAANQRIDAKDAHVSPSDSREMDISLQPNLPPSVYVVVWRTQSADDGHILSGSFLFSVARPDGTVPTLNGAVPGQNALGGGTSLGLYTGQLDGPALFNLLMVTLVDLGAIFWVGAQLWRTFVLQLIDPANTEQATIYQHVEQRFDRLFSLPTLLLLLLANIGVLMGQALYLTGGHWGQVFDPALLSGLVRNGHFGTYWILREVVILVAIAIAAYSLLMRRHPAFLNEMFSWANLLLALALLIAITLSGHAASVGSDLIVYAVLVDWLHLLAASLWIGGMMYIATIYLPILKGHSLIERVHSLLTTLPYYSTLAIVGVIVMTISGPFNAAAHMTSWEQLLTTAYGRALIVKVLLVGALLITSAIHVGIFRPRLAKDYKKYLSLIGATEPTIETEAARLASVLHAVRGRATSVLTIADSPDKDVKPDAPETVQEPDGEADGAASQDQPVSLTTPEVRQLEGRVTKQTRRLTTILRWEPILGIGVLICTGLLNVFAGTLLPPAANPAQPQSPTTPAKAFTTTVKTSDNKFTVTLSISPNHFGPNVFTVSVLDSNGKPDTNIGVSLYTTMLDMDMGTDTVNLQPDGKGHFSASGDLSMGGNWQVRIQIRTPDNTLHEAKVKFFTPI